MSEITKLYENAGVELVADVKFPTKDVNYNVGYPPFTAEKQLELIRWLGELQIDTRKGYWHLAKFGRTTKTIYANNGNSGEALSEIVNKLWQSLTDTERTQIKEILE